MKLRLVHAAPVPAVRQPLPRLKLTRAAVEGAKVLNGSKQQVYRFEEPPGMLLVVGTRSKTFAFQSDVGGMSRRLALGRYPHGLSVDAARARALELASQVARGRNL